MADTIQVKQYLAHWLQLGKGLMIQGGQSVMKPETVIAGDQYSSEFEASWQAICSSHSGECYLEGTDLTVEQLLSEQWDIIDCGRCAMPVPVPNAGVASSDCPCHDLPGWPNTELPQPRLPVHNDQHLQDIHQRLGPSKT
ncbi:MAG: hypothetical protein WA902_23310 [Thermosynechococcaceae cyanobacterium]